MRASRAAGAIVAAGCLALWLAASAVLGAQPDAASRLRDSGIRPVSPRTPAPDFTLPAIDGGDGSLSDYAGSWVVLTFWATWCGPCRSELPTLEALHRAHGGDGLAIVGVSVDDDSAPVAPFLAEMELSFPNYWDGSGAVGASYLASSIPTTYVIDPRGRVAGFSRGARDWMALAPLLQELLAAEPPGDPALASWAPAGERVSLTTVQNPPRADVELAAAEVRPGQPFDVTVRVTWSGSFDEYLLHPPEIALPAAIERLAVKASSSSRDGRSVVTYVISLEAAEPGRFALDPVELKYTPLLEQSPVAARLMGPTVAVAPRTVLGLAPRTAVAAGAGVALALAAGLAWRRRMAARPADGEPADGGVAALQARFEAARARRLSGDVRGFVLALVEIEGELDALEERPPESGGLIESVRYGGRLPERAELEQLERRVERRLAALGGATETAARRALKLRDQES